MGTSYKGDGGASLPSLENYDKNNLQNAVPPPEEISVIYNPISQLQACVSRNEIFYHYVLISINNLPYIIFMQY